MRVLVSAVRVFVCAVRVLVCAVRVFACAVSILFVQSQDFHGCHGNQTKTERVKLKINDFVINW